MHFVYSKTSYDDFEMSLEDIRLYIWAGFHLLEGHFNFQPTVALWCTVGNHCKPSILT